MAECPDESTLQALLDGELTGAPLEELDAHLAACDECRQFLDALTSCDTSHGLKDSATDDSQSDDPLSSVGSIVRDLQQRHSEIVLSHANDSTLNAPATLQPGMVLGEFYEIHELLGSGAMGAVFRATDTRVNREVAIKKTASNSAV